MTQTPVSLDPCPWPIDPGCLGDDWETLPASVRDRSTALAGASLRRLTAYRVGGCPITLRPRRTTFCGDLDYRGFMYPTNYAGVWTNGPCAPVALALPPPVGRLDEVKVDGVVLDPSEYRLHGNQLYRVEGEWPTTQDIRLYDTEPGTWSVTYLRGYQVDEAGAWAAGLLAMEFAKACRGDKKCRLPNNVQSVTRQGVTLELVTGTFPGGMTGIREVDAWVALWNPNHLTQQPQVWSPSANGGWLL